MERASRSGITIVSIIIVAFFCVGRILLPYIVGDTLDPDHNLNSQNTTTPDIPPTYKTPHLECLPQDTLRQTAEVVNVIDGDTIVVRLETGETYRLRYIGIDAPERNEELFEQSTTANKRLVDGKTIILVKDVSETDRFDRLLRYVLVNEIFVNYELVIRGYASSVTFPPDVACQGILQEAENIARQKNLGLWGYQATSTP